MASDSLMAKPETSKHETRNLHPQHMSCDVADPNGLSIGDRVSRKSRWQSPNGMTRLV